MVSNGYYILRRILFPILRHKNIFYARIMFGNSVLVDKFQGINNILLFQLRYSHAAPPRKCVHTLYHKDSSVFNTIPRIYRPKMQLLYEYKLIFSFPSVEHTLHRNTPLSTLRFCGVFCTTANMRTSQRTVYLIQRFAVSQRNCMRAITISPFLLSLLYRAESRRFSTLRCTKTGSTQPKLSAACFVVQSCLADADFVVFSNYCLIGTRQRLSFLRYF